jgi:GDP-mannose 6-dehydrogenase
MKETISIFGLGYVGSVMATCLAHKGYRVIGVDLNPQKVERLESGHSPVLEAGLEEMAAENRRACRLHATTDAHSAVASSNISFICVGTPSLRNGCLDLNALERVCREIGQALRQKDSFHTVVVRSTVLPGTTESIVIPTLEASSGKTSGRDFTVCFNPEFLREGCAVTDFHNPPFTVLGAANSDHLFVVRQIFEWLPGTVFETSLSAAEMVKYVCNAFHALKVSFANEIGTLCKHWDVDAELVMKIFASDSKLNISSAYLTPGFAFGGSCLPKDLRALQYAAQKEDVSIPLLRAILPSNQEHIQRAVDSVLVTKKKKVGMLGLSFKTGTDDLRESPQVELIKRLIGEGCQVQVWDEQVSMGQLVGSNRQFIEETIPHIGSLLTNNLQQVLQHAEVVVVGTKSLEMETLAKHLRPEQVVIDLVNLERSRRVSCSTTYEGICW